LALMLSATFAYAAARVEKLAGNLYAYVSDNDHSSNSTFLVGRDSILVVDTGLNAAEGQKLLAEIRKISPLPIAFIVNTHYHPDHQGGNGVVGPHAVVISSPFTRERTLQLIEQQQKQQQQPSPAPAAAAPPRPSFMAAKETVGQKLTIYMDGDPVEIIAAGPAHTMGDVYVYFPAQQTIATGDLFMNNSCPAMDQGDAANWVHALDLMAGLKVEHFVPGHFDVATQAGFLQFRDYLADLDGQVEKLFRAGVSAEDIAGHLEMSRYQSFRQFPQFHATFADNAATIYRQLKQRQ
ncbi:MAG TPA: MBL fold metallo-hydrolase, partial [Terriglobales bacterium]|nr:MBL fold metallo-hydrolase [Terriglobales bacterium]